MISLLAAGGYVTLLGWVPDPVPVIDEILAALISLKSLATLLSKDKSRLKDG